MNKKMMWGAVGAAMMLAGGLAGCGGSGGGDKTFSGESAVESARITRATEGNFSESARIIAAREAATSGAVWLSALSARRADADLQTIRTAFPQVAGISARSPYDLHTVVVAVPSSAPFVRNWLAGNAATGEPALDALLTEFAPEGIQSLGVPVEGGTAYFTLRFAQSLNMVKLAERLRGASVTITAADPNYLVGGGNDILRDKATGNREYVFSRGSGDCLAGCINRHSFVFGVSESGAASLLREEDTASAAGAPK